MFLILGAGEDSADVPGEGGEVLESLADGVKDLELNGKDEDDKNIEDGANADAKKKRRKRNRGKGNASKQTDPPSVPISQLFPDGKLNIKHSNLTQF